MVQVIQPSNKWATAGNNFGQGISEQIPKEVERYRLAKDLGNLSRESKDLTPFEQYSRLAVAAGNRPDIIQGGADILRQEAKKGKLPQFANKDNQPIQNKPPENKFPQTSPDQKREITPLSVEQSLLEPNLPPTEQQITNKANELYQENPTAYQTADEYTNKAKNLLQSDYDQKKALRNQSKVNDQTKTAIESEFDKETSNLGVDFKEKYGDLRQKILNKAYDDVASGSKTKAKAAKDASQELRTVAKDLNTIKEMGAEILPDANEQLKSLDQLQKKFHDLGEDELFYNELQSKMKLTKPYAKYKTHPYTPQYSKYLNSVKNLPATKIFTGKYSPSDNKKIALDLANNLNVDDSIQAGLLKLGEKNYDKGKILEEIRKLKNEKKIQLSDLQIDELDINPNQRMSLDDVYYFTNFGIPKTL